MLVQLLRYPSSPIIWQLKSGFCNEQEASGPGAQLSVFVDLALDSGTGGMDCKLCNDVIDN